MLDLLVDPSPQLGNDKVLLFLNIMLHQLMAASVSERMLFLVPSHHLLLTGYEERHFGKSFDACTNYRSLSHHSRTPLTLSCGRLVRITELHHRDAISRPGERIQPFPASSDPVTTNAIAKQQQKSRFCVEQEESPLTA